MAHSSTPGSAGAPAAVARVGDPDELVDAWEFSQIMGWSTRNGALVRLYTQSYLALRDRVRPIAAALTDGHKPAGRSPGRLVLRAVAMQLENHPDKFTPETIADELAELLGMSAEEVRVALRFLANRPGHRTPRGGEGLRLIPEPEADSPLRWRRRTIWEYADGQRGPAPLSRPPRFSQELNAAAEQAVLDAVDGTSTDLLTAEVMDGLARAVDPRFGSSTGSNRLEPARSLLTLALRHLQASGRIDLVTRAEIRERQGLSPFVLFTRLNQPGAPQPVIQVNRLLYYRAEDTTGL